MNSMNILIGLLVGFLGCCCDLAVRDPKQGDHTVSLTNSTPTKADPKKQEIEEIYQLLLNERPAKSSANPDVILEQTVPGEGPDGNKLTDVLSANNGYTSVGKELREEFVKQNRSPENIALPSELSDRYRLVNQEVLKSIFADARGWSEFHRRFPGAGLLEFSRIGFNSDRTEALVYMSESSGIKNGGGDYFVLTRIGKTWVIKEKINAWLS
jgi:hypothetical protein